MVRWLRGSPGGTDAFGRTTFRPLVTITLEHEGRSAEVRALIDSGADGTLLPAVIVEKKLGVAYGKLADGYRAGGIGRCETRRIDVTVRYRDWTYTGPVMVAEPASNMNTVLLGRADFLQAFRVTFDWSTEAPRFAVESRDLAPESPPEPPH